MTDKELLELAAKAIGAELLDCTCKKERKNSVTGKHWNPLQDDGDTFRLGVELDLLNDPRVISDVNVMMFIQSMPKLEAYRRAFTRVAAEIGRASQ